ncbi:glycoside hydrolase family 3 N-terminal domain-containing protein [Clostridium thermarum]|uniref:glycoside hydrolase family 3 N-terminal domain-containing protein n=1 Tax=Clostridium thermarum TaxID=1716543 RepID=UPI00111CC787|nr:glycoside hydrolase family 3 N-terminal domain-containing protein [Clostridium thermarum]
MLKKSLARFLATTFTATMLLGNVQPLAAVETPKYLNSSLSIAERVEDLLGRMSLEQKVGQMIQTERATTSPEDVKTYHLGSVLSGGGSLPTPNTAESWANMVDAYQAAAMSTGLGIPIIYGVDAVHGHNNVVGATIFPHNIGLGATGNTSLVKAIGEAVAEEVRATGVHWTFTPTLGIPHSERWGRTYETFGENAELVSKMGVAYIQGLQGDNPDKSLLRTDKVIATAKHFIGEGLAENGTNQGDIKLSEEDFKNALENELLIPYKAAIDAGVRSVMITYNSLNGEKIHGNPELITKVLKEELGFTGIVISDYNGIDQIAASTKKDKIAKAINAGIDMAMEPTNWKGFYTDLLALVKEGRVPQSRIDDAVTRILTVKFEMGLFEDPYAQRDLLDSFGSEEHRELARQAVRESLVLLKNDNDIVGRLKDMDNILVAGKSADDIGIQCGGWTISWQGSAGNITSGTTILQGIKDAVGDGVTVTYNKRGRASADNDVALVFIGETPYAESNGDKSTDALKLDSEDLTTLKNIKETNPDLPIVAVLVTGRPITIADQIEDFDGLIAAWLPGTEGQGIADVLLGDYDFTGKLTFTWPWYAKDIPLKHEAGKALFNYGYGLKKGETSVLPEKPEEADIPASPIPGKLEVEEARNQNGFSFENCSDEGGGQNAGWTDAGDWLDWYVDVEEEARYKVTFRVSSPGGSTGGLELYAGSRLQSKADVPDTGAWQNWTSVSGTANLKAGKQTIRFRAGAGNFNINWISFEKVGPYEEGPEDPQEPEVIYTPEGNMIEEDYVQVWMSSSEQSQSMSWYDSPEEISNKLARKFNLDITSPDGQEATTILIDTSKTYQTFLGMGTSMEESTVNNLAKMSQETRTDFLKKLVDPVEGAGMSILRVTIGTADFTGQEFYTYYDEIEDPSNPDWYNTTGKGFSIQKDIDYKIVDTIKEILAINPDVKLFASSWTPPGWMKLPTSNSNSYPDNEKLLKGGKLNDDFIDDLAKYYVRFMEEYAKLGIPIYAITLQNEPELEINYPSCNMTPAQELKLAIAIKTEVAASEILKYHNIAPKLWAFDHNFSGAVSYMAPIFGDEEGYAAVDGVAFHDYSGEPTAMTQMHNLYPEKEMHLTERSVWGTSGADRIAQYFRNYAESYTAWVTMLDSNIAPEQWTGTPDPTMFVQDANDRNNYWATPEYYISGQFTKFIRPGAVRIDTNYGSSSTVTNVAFQNTDGSIVMVVINQTDKPQKFVALCGGTQFGDVIPAKNVATYKWYPIVGIKVVPGKIEAEDLTGGYDFEVENGHVGYMHEGSYLDYIIDVKEAGLYNVTFHYATADSKAKSIDILQGSNILGSVTVMPGTDEHNWQWGWFRDVRTTVKFEKAGQQKIRLLIHTGEFNLDSFTFEKIDEIHTLPGIIQAENFLKASSVGIENLDTPNVTVGYIESGDILEYKVNVPVEGDYPISVRLASDVDNPGFNFYSDDELIATMSFTKTGGWSNCEIQSDVIHLKAGEQTIKLEATNGFNIDWFAIGQALIAASEASILEGTEDGSTITVTLINGTFADNLTAENWTIANLPQGVTLGAVERVNATTAELSLEGNRTVDYDSDIELTVTCAAAEFNGIAGTSAKLMVTAINDGEILTSESDITPNTSEVIVKINGGNFIQDKVNTITLSGAMISAGNVALDSVEYINSTEVKIKLKNWKTYYEDLTLTVNVPVAAYSDSTSGTPLKVDITCVHQGTLPTPITLGDDPVTLTEAIAFRLKGSLVSNVATGNRADYFLKVEEAGDYTLTFAAYNNGGVTNALKLSKGRGINIDGNLITYNMGNFWGSINGFKDTIRLEAGEQTLRFEAVSPEFRLHSVKIEKKAQPIGISSILGEKSVIMADAFFRASNDKGYAIETKNGIKNIGCTVAGSWLDYSIDVSSAGKYKVNLNYGTNVGGAIAVLQTETGRELSRMPLASNGSWDAFVDTTTPMYVTLTAGEQILRVYVDGDGYNYRSLTFEPVVDQGAPVISGKDGAVEIGTEVDLIRALSIVATDDLDGNITSKVVIDDSAVNYAAAGTYDVKVSVTDDSGNTSEVTFKLTVKEDATAPVILGKNAVIAVGSTFNPIRDLGISVTDNKDGDITSKAIITHQVVTDKVAIFVVKVAAVDKAGNSSEKYFVVRVLEEGQVPTDPEEPSDPSGGGTMTLPETASIVNADVAIVITVINCVTNNGKVFVDITNNKIVAKEIFDAIKGTDKTVIFTQSGIEWSFNGRDIAGTTKTIDMTFAMASLSTTTSSNKAAISQKANNEEVLVLSFANNGQLPGKARIKVKLDEAWLDGKDKNNLNLYYYNEVSKAIETVANGLGSDPDGYVHFDITHNSDYIIMDKDLTKLPKPITTVRLGGANRYETSVMVSQAGWTTAENVVLARGDDFADALCAAPFAKQLNAPILLTSTKTLDSSVIAELKRLNPKKVYVIGGIGAISTTVETQVKAMGIVVERIAGNDRYETSLAIANRMTNKGQVFLATGTNFADALSISSYAAAIESPILLTAKVQISADVANFIKTNKSKVYVIGGDGVVSEAVVKSIAGAERISGTDRYATNLAILNKFEADFDFSNIYLTTGSDYPDAICTSALAACGKSPIILVNTKDTAAQNTYIKSIISKVKTVNIIGGEGVISTDTVEKVLK